MTDDLRTRLAEVIGEAMGHERDEESPECDGSDYTLGCQHTGGHDPVPGCETCAEFGWPCDPALRAADVALAFLIGAGGITRESLAAAVERVREGAEPSLDAADIRRDVYPAPDQLAHESPRGVTLAHLPTGLVASCHTERSGVQNVAAAYQKLRRLVAEAG